MNFDPEIVIVDSDPETRVLTQNFTLTYTISSATELQLNKSLGQVDIRDPFETVQVGSHTLLAFLYMVCSQPSLVPCRLLTSEPGNEAIAIHACIPAHAFLHMHSCTSIHAFLFMYNVMHSYSCTWIPAHLYSCMHSSTCKCVQ